MTARDLALVELDQRHLPGWPPRELRSPRRGPPTDPRDRALAEQILVGVIKNHLLLQQLIERYSGRRLKSIDALVQKILSIALYQLHFLDRVPSSAAVNEAVEQAKRFGRTKAAGFVNAILRKAATAPISLATLAKPATREYAYKILSHPYELVDRLEKLLGISGTIEFAEHDNREAPTILRLSPGVLVGALDTPGVQITAHEAPGMYVVDPAKKAVLADWSRRQLAQVQDPTAAGVVEHCAIEPGQSVLDRCAGLGTKTMQMRAKVGDAGSVVAVDPSPDRCRTLRSLLAERHLTNVLVHQVSMLADISEHASRQFDVALLDVPCSNSGVLARRPEARYAQTPEALRSLEKLQLAILEDTAAHVRPGGRLVYSTCSVWPEENEMQVTAFLQRHPDFSRQSERSTLPSCSPEPTKYHDGGYFAVLVRT